MENNTKNITIPWESRNALVIYKDSIINTEKDIKLSFKNFPKIILHILTWFSGLQWAIIETRDNSYWFDINKFFTKNWFGYKTEKHEVLNNERLTVVADEIKKYAKEEIISSIEMQSNICEQEQHAFHYLYESNILSKKNITKALEVFFKWRIENILEKVPERDPDETGLYQEKEKEPKNKFFPEDELSEEDNKILAYMLENDKLSSQQKGTIFLDSSLFTWKNFGTIYQNIIKKYLPENNLIETYIEKFRKTK